MSSSLPANVVPERLAVLEDLGDLDRDETVFAGAPIRRTFTPRFIVQRRPSQRTGHRSTRQRSPSSANPGPLTRQTCPRSGGLFGKNLNTRCVSG